MTGVRAVTSNQTDIYKNLEQVVRKYATTCFLRPVADHTREAFESALQFVENFYQNAPDAPAVRAVILDSGCGAGESTVHLARKFLGVPVIGIDKSAVRLNKAGNVCQLMQPEELPDSCLHENDNGESANDKDVIPGNNKVIPDLTGNLAVPENAFWVRAELLDFWRLALEAVQQGRWNILHHALYYPNPWPKESAATRRFHLHPVFPTLLQLSPVTELRTNWAIYAKEFAEAARIVLQYGANSPSSAKITCEAFNPTHPETAFERKYKEARQQLWRTLVKR